MSTRRNERPRRIGDADALARVARAAKLVAEHGSALRSAARSVAASPEDADDAFQRGIEILLRKAPLDAAPPQLLAWAKVVIRREALAVWREHRQRAELSEPIGPAALEGLPSPAPGPLATIEERDRVDRAGRLLDRLKPQERRALALQAAGCSYAEIRAITGWTHTKVNRCLAEGRAQLRSMPPPAA